jgi:hypothetical protein
VVSPLEGQIRKQIGKGFSGIFLAATLTRDGATTGPAYDPIKGTPASYSCKAVVDTYSDYLQSTGLVSANDRQVLILAESLSVMPAPMDRITIRNATFTISKVDTDPALAVWTCKAST